MRQASQRQAVTKGDVVVVLAGTLAGFSGEVLAAGEQVIVALFGGGVTLVGREGVSVLTRCSSPQPR